MHINRKHQSNGYILMTVTEANGEKHQYVMTPSQARNFERQLHIANRQADPAGIHAAERGR